MDATEANYELLARTLCAAQGIDPDAMTRGECTEWEMQAIDEDSDLVSTTRDTLDDFRRNSKKWREPGTCEEINSGLYWAECQATKGQRRCELCIVDCGEFRLMFQC